MRRERLVWEVDSVERDDITGSVRREVPAQRGRKPDSECEVIVPSIKAPGRALSISPRADATQILSSDVRGVRIYVAHPLFVDLLGPVNPNCFLENEPHQ